VRGRRSHDELATGIFWMSVPEKSSPTVLLMTLAV
jgi:hypothetical protein